jgi:predicted acyl esterase
VLDPGGTDVVDRVENEFPLDRTQYQQLFLDASTGTLSTKQVEQETMARYRADDGKGKATFTIRFDQDTELIGYLKLRLWVEAKGGNDMDLFVVIQKLDKRGKRLTHMVTTFPNRLMGKGLKLLYDLGILKLGALFYSGPNGRLRVSHRQLDPARSTAPEPYLTHRVEELLSPGQVVPVEIPIWPTGMRWHAGEQLRLVVAGYDVVGPMLPGIPKIPTRNKGEHLVHTGGKYDSHLLVPMIPQ